MRRRARRRRRRAALGDAAHRRHVRGSSTSARNAADRRRARATLLGPAGPGVVVVVTNPVDPLVTRLQRRTGLDRQPRPRLHAQRQPAAAHRPRPGARRRAGQRRGVGDRRARRRERPALRPGRGRRRSRPAHGRAGARPRRSTAHLVLAARRARLGALVDLDVRPRRRPHGRGARTATASSGLRPSCSRASTASTGVAVTVPVTLGRGGAEQIHEWELSPDELDGAAAVGGVRPCRGRRATSHRDGGDDSRDARTHEARRHHRGGDRRASRAVTTSGCGSCSRG